MRLKIMRLWFLTFTTGLLLLGCAMSSPTTGEPLTASRKSPVGFARHDVWQAGLEQARAAIEQGDWGEGREAWLAAAGEAVHFQYGDPRLHETVEVMTELLEAGRRGGASQERVDLLAALDAAAREAGAASSSLALYALERRVETLLSLDQPGEAESVARLLVERAEGRVGGAAAATEGRLLLARALDAQGHLSEAAEQARFLIENTEAMWGPRSPQLARALSVQSGVHRSQGRLGQALELLERAVEISEEASGKASAATAYFLMKLGSVQSVLFDLDAAEASLERARHVLEAQFADEDAMLASTLARLADLHVSRGQLAKASQEIERALALDRALEGESGPALAADLALLATLHHLAGDDAAAHRVADQALEIVAAEPPGLSACTRMTVSTLEARLGRWESARKLAKRALQQMQERYGRDDPEVRGPLHLAAWIDVRQGRTQKAASRGERALEMFAAHYGGDTRHYAEVLVTVAEIRVAQGRFEEARRLIGEGRDRIRERYGSASPYLVDALEINELLLRAEGYPEKALRVAQEIATTRRGWPELMLGQATAQAPIVDQKYRFRLERLPSEWIELDPALFGGDAAGRVFARKDPPVSVVILSGAADADASASAGLAERLRAGVPRDAEILSEKPRELAGVQGLELRGRWRRRETSGKAEPTVLWLGIAGGWVYLLAAQSPDPSISPDEVARLSAGLLAGFSVLEAPQTRSQPGQLASHAFSYTVDLPSGWGPWDELAASFRRAELGARYRDVGGFAMIPVALFATDPDEGVALSTLLELLGVNYPADPERVDLEGQAGIQVDVHKSFTGGEFEYRVRALRGRDALYLAVAWVETAKRERSDEVFEILDHLHFDSRRGPTLAIDSLSERERDLHTSVLTGIGLRYSKARQYQESLPFFDRASRIAPDPLSALVAGDISPQAAGSGCVRGS